MHAVGPYDWKQASKQTFFLRPDRTIFHVGNALGKLVPAALLADCMPRQS